jgi:hypothetical protein
MEDLSQAQIVQQGMLLNLLGHHHATKIIVQKGEEE